ncbi:hypothetical protein K1719_032026 [Acacia pycnantha]|nr:hypothetical protein K1719_032026 [Acacia pycnantha]
MAEVRKVMQNFCEVSGHRINLQKSRMFCSKNINFNRAVELSQRLGIGLTADLGKYLGKPSRENPSPAPRALLLLFFALLSLRFGDSQVHGLRSDLFQILRRMWKMNQLILHFC